MTNIRREDSSCTCYRGVGALAGKDECRCSSIDTSDPTGPKFRTKTADHTQEVPYTTESSKSSESSESLDDLLKRELAERDANARKMGLLTCPACNGESSSCSECEGKRYVFEKEWEQNEAGGYDRRGDGGGLVQRARNAMIARNRSSSTRARQADAAPSTGNIVADARAAMVRRNANLGRR